MDITNKVVIITGASRGIGAATARAFAMAGARVALAARDATQLAELARELPNAPLVVPTDVTDLPALERLVASTLDRFGAIDIVVNNAGVGVAGPVATLDAAAMRAAFEVDLFGPLALTQAALPYLRQRRHSQLIFVSSVVGLRALPYNGGYAAAKAALDRLTESLRVELRGSGIAVTLVRPGTTGTSFSNSRLGSGSEIRRVNRHAVAPAVVAQTILRAAQRQPRVAYVSLADQAQVLISLALPRLSDWLLGRTFGWKE